MAETAPSTTFPAMQVWLDYVEQLKAALLELADAAAEDYHDGSLHEDCRVCAAVQAADKLLGATPRKAGYRADGSQKGA